MAKIIQPGDGRSSTDARLDVKGPLFTSGGATSITNAQRQVGKELEKSGEAYFKLAENSIKDSFYNDAMSTATLELNKRFTERLSQTTDKHGNPTFKSLDQDVQKIAQDIQDSLALKLVDNDVRNKFNISFSNMVTSKRLQAQTAARNQQLAYAQSSLNKALNSFVEGARTDEDANINQYTGQVAETVDDAIVSGVLSPEEGQALKQEYTDSIRVSAYQKAIEKNPKEAAEMISKGAGVSEDNQRKLENLAKAAVKDEENLIKKQSSDIRNKVSKQQQDTLLHFETGMLSGTIGLKDIETAANSNMDISNLMTSLHPKVASDLAKENPVNITETQKQQLIAKLDDKVKKDEEKAIIADDINAMIEKDIRIHTEVPEVDIEEYYTTEIGLLAGEQAPTLADKARVAARITAPLKSFKDDIKFGLNNATGQNAQEVLAAYKNVMIKQPITLDKLSKSDKAIGAYATMLVDHANMPAEKALEIAREANDNSKQPEIRKERESGFKSIDSFKSGKIENTIKDIFNLDSFMGFGGKALQPGIKARFESLLREAYVMTGNEAAAKNTLRDMVKHTYGVSEFNEIPGVLDDTERFMYMPPEVAYPGVSTASLKQNLSDNLVGLLPEGVTADKVGISSDELTRANDQRVTYGLFYIDNLGMEQVLMDHRGIPLRWEPDYKDMIQKKNLKEIEQAKESRQKVIAAQTSLGKQLGSGFGIIGGDLGN